METAPWTWRWGLRAWSRLLRAPWLYRQLTRVALPVLASVGRRKGHFSKVIVPNGWTEARDLPAPQGHSFLNQWRREQRDSGNG